MSEDTSDQIMPGRRMSDSITHQDLLLVKQEIINSVQRLEDKVLNQIQSEKTERQFEIRQVTTLLKANETKVEDEAKHRIEADARLEASVTSVRTYMEKRFADMEAAKSVWSNRIWQIAAAVLLVPVLSYLLLMTFRGSP